MEHNHVLPLCWVNPLVYIHIGPNLVIVFTDITYYTPVGTSNSAPHCLQLGQGIPFQFHGIYNLVYIVFAEITLFIVFTEFTLLAISSQILWGVVHHPNPLLWAR